MLRGVWCSMCLHFAVDMAVNFHLIGLIVGHVGLLDLDHLPFEVGRDGGLSVIGVELCLPISILLAH